uniref:DNA-directed RNA polymerases I, II, and III subunit RPABC1 n=1 Tax=Timspurckia oligopyrenoides TaxID=708627 RepID=A0A7S1ESI1_9RHOD|mmetsp:Transcript_4550/g.7967  ORF Transcript_4550/g.7967 Transcript_4550/m.7967 type:complete len:210 (+) Transcript_4550:75-704(+)|eukprot:CAMPEP_0182441258 /NCGR_PEP_ID=MMETSP1172-20130603/205_1 /TAXON_ID=708627 /ORGANISM="Timspurckia oligopyrenoides, Strain CCMP3278" /LENGTH=209 /DNA_ID=CAMNT_0024635437 /DNA_START=42 /DNA_END=671 /DNA_ORIENTATION=+
MATMDQEITRMFRVRRTVLQLLRDRGYLVLDTDTDLGMSAEQFRERYAQSKFAAEALTILKSKRDNPSDQIYVFFPQDPKLGVKPIREYCERMQRDGIHHAIIVLLSGMTPSAKEAVHIVSSQHRLELFLQNELLVNITEHVLVPKHELLSPAEKRALLKMYKLKESQLPRIQMKDPVARYYGLTPGQVVRITRPSETAGRYVTYRLVV